MAMLMTKCKTCGEVIPGVYIPEQGRPGFKAHVKNVDTSHICSRGHKSDDTRMNMSWKIIWTGLELLETSNKYSSGGVP
jgi:hypothetical protein